MDRQDAERVAERAAEALGPEAGLVASLDPVSLARAMAEVGAGLARHPFGGALAGIRYAAGLAATGAVSAARAFGGETSPPIPPPARDRRFADEAWAGNPLFFGLQQSYLLTARLARELVAAAELEPRWRAKAELATQLLIDAMAPTNFLATNPAALKRAFDTGGRSAAKGINNLLDDLVSNGGKPRQVDTSPFTLGENLAATKGKVVFRNSLMELLQYSPTTRTTYETPILCSPPWINKYYVMDLAPGRSFIQWAVDHGHTVFAISYRNPDTTMRGVKLDDYLLQGPVTALDVVRDITGAPQANVVGLCLGGTLTTMLIAYLDAIGDQRVKSATLLNTLIDFSAPGVLGELHRPRDGRAPRGQDGPPGLPRGPRDGHHLRPAAGQRPHLELRGQQLADGRGPAGLRHPGLERRLDPHARGHALVLPAHLLPGQPAGAGRDGAGRGAPAPGRGDPGPVPGRGRHRPHHPLDLLLQHHPAGQGGHPVRAQLLGPHRGHRQPAQPQGAALDQRRRTPPDPDVWLAGATEHPGSWWDDWVGWAKAHGGQRRKPPPMGSDRHPPIADAPGSYIHEK